MQIVLFGVLVLLLRAALAIHHLGLVRSKNSASAVARNLVDICVAVLSFALVGAAIVAMEPRLLLAGLFAGVQWQSPVMLTMAAVLPSAIVTGVVAERSRFWPMLLLTVAMAGLIFPITAWLAQRAHHYGFLDLGGASFIHLTGGLAACVASIFVGPRAGKYNRDGSASAIPGHNVPLAGVGALLAVVAWIGYVAGFAVIAGASLGAVAVNTLLCAAAGGVSSTMVSQLRYGKPDLHLIVAGMLGALVSISAGAAAVAPFWAIVIGLVAGVIIPAAALAIDLLAHIDDPTSGIAIHAAGGLWGLLAAPIFAAGIDLLTRVRVIGVQLLTTLIIAAIAVGISLAVLLLVRTFTKLRASEADEYDGLDLAEHDVGAYPDFQQTMIKSYHLREA